MANIKVLIVEDEKIVAKDIQYRVKSLGYEVCGIASSGEEAIENADTYRPDLVLMDIQLKGEIDGVTAADRIRSFLDIPIIYLTAYNDKKTLERAKTTNPFGYILKPFEDRDLFTGIEMALNKHRIDKSIRESEKWLSTVLQSIGDAVITTDTDGIVTYINPIAQDLTGWSQEDAYGKELDDVFQVVDDKSGERITDTAMQILEGNLEKHRADNPVLISRDGVEQLIEYRGTPIKDELGTVGVVMVVFHDVTERLRAAKALMESFQTSADIVRSIPTGLLIFQLEGKDRFVLLEGNPEAERLIKRKVDGWIAKEIEEIWPPIGDLELKDAFLEVMRTGEPFERDALHVKGDRTEGHFNIRAFRMPGKRLGIAVKDVTEQKTAEIELEKVSNFLKFIVDNANDWLTVMDDSMNVLVWNKAAETISGYGSEDVVGGTEIWKWLYPDEAARKTVKERFTRILSGGELELDHETVIRTKYGGDRTVAWNASRHFDENGLVIGVIEVGRDITERKKAEDRIRSSLREKEVLLREIHHRVKNNLQIISSLLHLQSKKVMDTEAHMMFMESMNRIRTMSLLHAKLYESQDLANIDFGEYLNGLTSFLFQSFGVRSEVIGYEIDVGDIHLSIDTGIPCGLIANELISNALKYAFPDGRKGKIGLTLREVGDSEFELRISDDGVGLPEGIDIGSKDTLGMQLIGSLADHLDGTVEIDRSEGTAFIVRFRELTYKERK